MALGCIALSELLSFLYVRCVLNELNSFIGENISVGKIKVKHVLGFEKFIISHQELIII